jgi:uncharacterized protein YjbI with pentapeptide repeats
MTGNNLQNGSGGGQIDRSDSADQLTDRSDLTARTFSSIVVEGASAQQALFAGTLFRSCTFLRCNFQRSDFEGAILEECSFEDCDFSLADFRSIEAARTRFVRCKFNEGATRTSRFIDCSFDSCELMVHNFEQNRVERTHLIDCRFERSTVLHCHFSHVEFANTDLADCTSQFHIFDVCKFTRSMLNAEAIGLTVGLTSDNISSIGLLWRGEELPKHGSGDELVRDLATTYEARGWRFAAAMLRLNFQTSSRIGALNDVFGVLGASLASTRPVLSDEISFLSNVIEWLSRAGRLPFVAIAQGLELCVGAAEHSVRNEELVRPLYHALKDAELFELEALERTVSSLNSRPTALAVKFIFDEEPPISFRHWIDELASSGLLSDSAPQFRGASRGSYIELFYMAAATLASVLVCLGLVERIVDRLVYIRARGGVLVSPKLPQAVRRRALQPITVPPRELLREMQAYLRYASDPRHPRLTADTEVFTGKLRRIEVGEGES